jgi:hypothetical protein
MSQQTSSRSNCAILITASLLAVLLPMSQLLRPGLAPRVNDWENSLWAAGYTGQYLLAHHALPGVFNTDKFVGHPAPVFYGPLLFPFLGVLGDVVGIGPAVRGAVMLAWTLQFFLAFRLVRLVTASRLKGLAAAAMVCWAIYPLTNLYNRGAIAEFFGTTLLFCAACAGGLAVLEPDRRRRIAFGLLCGLCGAAAAGSHAITAVVGGISLLCLAHATLLLGAPPTKQTLLRRYAATAALGLAAAVAVSAWLFATLEFSGRLHVASVGASLGFIPEYDAWYVRLSPVPLPTPASGILSVGIPATPYLDPQLNSAMLALLLWTLFTLWRTKRQIGTAKAQSAEPAGAALLLRVSLVLFGAAFLLSVVPGIGWHLPAAVGGLIQFAYRLVTYQNLAIFVALVATLALGAQPAGLPARLQKADTVAWALALALSGVGLTVKLAHAAWALGPASAEAAWAADPSRLGKMPDTYYGERDYVVVDESRMLASESRARLQNVTTVDLPLSNSFGEPGAAPLDEPADRWVRTDVIAFSWNRLVLDGRVLPPAQTRDAPNRLAARVHAGRHTLGYAFDPPLAWRVLRVVSFATAIVWAALVAVLFACRIRAGIRR